MKTIIKVCIRLFVVFTVFQFINNIVFYFNSFVQIFRSNIIHQSNITFMDYFIGSFPIITVWGLYIVIVTLLWIKSEKITDKIIDVNQSENVNYNLDYKNLLSVGLIILAIYLIIDTTPIIFGNISNLIISRTRFVSREIYLELTISNVVGIISIFIKIIMAYILIKYNDKIMEKIYEKKNNE